MANNQELNALLSNSELEHLEEILRTFVTQNKVERIYLNRDVLYKWLGGGNFKKGVIKKEIQLD